MSQNDKDKLPYTLVDDQKTFKDRIQAKENVRITSGRGDDRRMIANIFSGFNHRNIPLIIPKNNDRVGYTFFTRPDLNFDERNVRVSRLLQEALRGGYSSYTAACMCMLDPQCGLFTEQLLRDGITDLEHHMPFADYGVLGGKIRDTLGFDNKCAFVPMLSNLMLSLTGFPDSSLDVWVSEEGYMREQRSHVDSTRAMNGSRTLNLTLRNILGDPVSTFFNLYTDYISRVKDGSFYPRWDNLLQRRSDYEMRIYRFVTDVTGRYVTKMGIANATYPLNDSMGMFMNVPNQNNEIITETDQLSITLQCDVVQYNDPIIKQEFNEVVCMHNPDMWPANARAQTYRPRGKGLVNITGTNKINSNLYGYPRVDIDTNELQWWGYEKELNLLSKR